jgi:hypothetical protein
MFLKDLDFVIMVDGGGSKLGFEIKGSKKQKGLVELNEFLAIIFVFFGKLWVDFFDFS